MENKNTDFPQYRLLSNGKTCYKITNERVFEEIQRVGSKHLYFRMEATQYPEMVRIQEMLHGNQTLYQVVNELVWESFYHKIERSK